MKLKMHSLMAGPKGTFHPGKIYEFDEKTAAGLIAAGAAEAVGGITSAIPADKEEDAAETAVLTAPENTANPQKGKAEAKPDKPKNEKKKGGKNADTE